MKRTDFAKQLSDFLKIYLPGTRRLSENTIMSYRDAFRYLLAFAQEECKIPPDNFEMKHLTSDLIYNFLLWLDSKHSNSSTTRQLRLAAIRSFIGYVKIRIPDFLFESQKILELRVKRIRDNRIKYLSVDEVKALLNAPSIDGKYNRRDRVLLSLMYDAALRVQEICDLTVGDVRLDNPPSVTVLGKGKKVRTIPIEKATAILLQPYLKENNRYRPEHFHLNVFFNHKGEKMTRAGVAYILRKYWKKACTLITASEKKISPHMLRHSKAMHMKKAGVELVQIRDFLGHESIVTTEVYAHVDIETKKNVIENVIGDSPVLPDWTEDETLMSLLNNLCK